MILTLALYIQLIYFITIVHTIWQKILQLYCLYHLVWTRSWC